MISAPEPALVSAIAALMGAMVAGTIARFIGLRHSSAETRKKRFASLRTWWMLSIAVSLGLLAGRLGITVLLGAASCIAWFEITKMFGARAADRPAIRAGYALIILNYLVILTGTPQLFPFFLPITSMFVIAILLLVQGEPKGYIRSAGGLLWGMLFLGYGVSHAAVLMILPASSVGPMGPAGWFLFLVILTETDDIFQAVVGRLFGSHKRHRISPVISPN